MSAPVQTAASAAARSVGSAFCWLRRLQASLFRVTGWGLQFGFSDIFEVLQCRVLDLGFAGHCFCQFLLMS